MPNSASLRNPYEWSLCRPLPGCAADAVTGGSSAVGPAYPRQAVLPDARSRAARRMRAVIGGACRQPVNWLPLRPCAVARSPSQESIRHQSARLDAPAFCADSLAQRGSFAARLHVNVRFGKEAPMSRGPTQADSMPTNSARLRMEGYLTFRWKQNRFSSQTA